MSTYKNVGNVREHDAGMTGLSSKGDLHEGTAEKLRYYRGALQSPGARGEITKGGEDEW